MPLFERSHISRYSRTQSPVRSANVCNYAFNRFVHDSSYLWGLKWPFTVCNVCHRCQSGWKNERRKALSFEHDAHHIPPTVVVGTYWHVSSSHIFLYTYITNTRPTLSSTPTTKGMDEIANIWPANKMYTPKHFAVIQSKVRSHLNILVWKDRRKRRRKRGKGNNQPIHVYHCRYIVVWIAIPICHNWRSANTYSLHMVLKTISINVY